MTFADLQHCSEMTPEVDADKASQHQEFYFSSICSHCEKTDFPTDEIGFEMAHVVAARVSATGFVKIIDAGPLSLLLTTFSLCL